MSIKNISYEHPLNEKIRVFLRIEYLWQELNNCFQKESDKNCIIGMECLLNILDINERFDLRSDAIKYLDKLLVKFSKINEQPDVDHKKLLEIMDNLNKSLSNLKLMRGKTAAKLSTNDWLTNIRQKMLLPGGLSSSDLPFYKYWQQFPLDKKLEQLMQWQDHFYQLVSSINNILFYIRKTSKIYSEVAVNGTFQKIIDSQFDPQLVLIKIPESYNIYPEVSGNKYRMAIRFLQTDLVQKANVYTDNVEFELSICS